MSEIRISVSSSGLTRVVFQGVAIAVVSNLCNKLIDWGIEELKRRRESSEKEELKDA